MNNWKSYFASFIILTFTLLIHGEENAGNKGIHNAIIHKIELKTDLNHLIFDRIYKTIFVAGRNRLYQLTPDLDIIATVKMGPQKLSEICDESECDNKQVDNINKILLIEHSLNRVIICGTMYHGSCSTRNALNILSSTFEEDTLSDIVAESENQSTVAFIAPESSSSHESDRHVMYVGVSMISGVDLDAQEIVPIISTRNLTNNIFQFESIAVDTETAVYFNKSIQSYNIRYVYGFSSKGFSYFMSTQPKNIKTSPREYITKLVRLCQNDSDYYSYTEIPVDCVGKDQSIKYNLVQAAFLGKAGDDLAKSLGITTEDVVLYAVFSESKENIPTNRSALCIYPLKSIRQKFMENIQSCFDGHGSKGLEYIRRSIKKPCIAKQLPIEEDFCGSKLNYPIDGVLPISAVPVTTFKIQLTAITVTHTKGFTVAFVGTIDGDVKKVFIKSQTSGIEYDDLEIHKNSAINADLQLDDYQHLYVMTKDRVTKIKIYDCKAMINCTEIMNPYCEWCSSKSSYIIMKETGFPLNSNQLIIIGVVVIILATVISMTIAFNGIYKRRSQLSVYQNKLNENLEEIDPLLSLIEQAERLPYVEKYEFPQKKLNITKILGEGHYGIVYEGTARGIIKYEGVTKVAVKKVKRDEVLDAFIKELKIMCHLGKHLNVINLLGACTKTVRRRDIMIIVEYCEYGNLQRFLRENRSGFIDQINRENDTIDTKKTMPIGLSNNFTDNRLKYANLSLASHDPYINAIELGLDEISVTNSAYSPSSIAGHGPPVYVNQIGNGTPTSPALQSPLIPSGITQKPSKFVDSFTTTDLLSWLFQITRGMHYLASRKILHNDFAARNVLLCEDKVVKICDFGLARSLYKTDIYRKKGDDAMAYKWLALESNVDSVFSTKTDVWSFGIVMWELFSLGQGPYPDIDSKTMLIKQLTEGYRMIKPEFATQDIYDIMLSCWHINPDRRPFFNGLESSIYKLLERNVAKYYISLNEPYEEENANNLNFGQIDYIALMASPDHPAPQIPNFKNINETNNPNENNQSMRNSLESVNDSWTEEEDEEESPL